MGLLAVDGEVGADLVVTFGDDDKADDVVGECVEAEAVELAAVDFGVSALVAHWVFSSNRWQAGQEARTSVLGPLVAGPRSHFGKYFACPPRNCR